MGPLTAAGPIIGVLSGVGVLSGFAVGGTVGGIAGGLIGAGMPEYKAKRYEGRIRTGGILLFPFTATIQPGPSARKPSSRKRGRKMCR